MRVSELGKQPSRLERLMSKKVEVWLVGLLCVVALVGVVVCSALARVTATGDRRFGRAGRVALEISLLPEHVIQVTKLLIYGDKADLAVKEDRFDGQRGFEFSYPPGGDPNAGYLLLSRYDGDLARSVVELVDLDAQRTVHTWQPTLERTARTILHPLATVHGELVFHSTSPIVKVDACGERMWSIDRTFHHSIERHPEGGYLTSAYIRPPTIPGVGGKFWEDSIVHVSEGGRIIYEKSVPRLLIENGLSHLIYGMGTYFDDPIHLNDIQYVPFDGAYFRKGDLFLSLRNPDAIVLYRPSTNIVVWMKQGPWVDQHDVDVLDDRRIAVFNNNRFAYVDADVVNGSNEVMIHDFENDATTSPYREYMRALDVRTSLAGRSEITADGDVVIEETQHGRLLRLRESGTLEWTYVNRATDGQVYVLNWSRYLPPDEGRPIAGGLASTVCGQQGDQAAREHTLIDRVTKLLE